MYYFFAWRDACEILFFTSIFYQFSLWLSHDRQKNLLGYFYLYCILTFLTYLVQLPTLTYAFFIYGPAVIMIFILMHQETLQRNLVALKNIIPAQITHDNWLEILFKSCLKLINNNKAIICVIEHTDQLNECIDTPLFINADLQNNILDLFLDSPSFDQHKMVWISTQGKLRGINGTWQKTNILKLDKKFREPWHTGALIYSTRTDALIFHLEPTTRTFTIIVHGKELTNVAAHHAQQLITKHIKSSTTQGKHYEAAQSQKNNLRQRVP